jgi:FlaA1/EpsC-like NDP-sugar epimerase
LQVYKPKHIQQMIDETGAQEILLAIPSSTRARRREILGFLEGLPAAHSKCSQLLRPRQQAG